MTVSDVVPSVATATSWTRPVAVSTCPSIVDSTASHSMGRAWLTSLARAAPV